MNLKKMQLRCDELERIISKKQDVLFEISIHQNQFHRAREIHNTGMELKHFKAMKPLIAKLEEIKKATAERAELLDKIGQQTDPKHPKYTGEIIETVPAEGGEE